MRPLLVYGYYSHVKRASISEAKNGLSALIDRVKAGESVLIVDRGTPVARVEPVTASGSDERVARLVRAGLVRPAKSRLVLPRDLPVPRKKGLSAVEALLEERRAGR